MKGTRSSGPPATTCSWTDELRPAGNAARKRASSSCRLSRTSQLTRSLAPPFTDAWTATFVVAVRYGSSTRR